MQEISFKSPAKLNLALDVEQLDNKLINNKINNNKYHDLKMIVQTIDLFDYITISKTNSDKIHISSTGFVVPEDSKNIVYKAILKFFESTKIAFNGIDVKILKNIPVQAGLGGGSSNAALTLIALDKLFFTNLSLNEFQNIGKDLGADVSLFFLGGTCLCEGIGEKVTKLRDLQDVYSDVYFLVIKPDVGFSTAEIYNRFDNIKLKKRPNIDKIIFQISNKKNINNNINIDINNTNSSKDNMFLDIYNVLEEAIDRKHYENKQIFDIKNKLIDMGATASQMTGSGSAVFGVFLNKIRAQEAFEILKKDYKNIFLCRPISGKDYLNFKI